MAKSDIYLFSLQETIVKIVTLVKARSGMDIASIIGMVSLVLFYIFATSRIDSNQQKSPRD